MFPSLVYFDNSTPLNIPLDTAARVILCFNTMPPLFLKLFNGLALLTEKKSVLLSTVWKALCAPSPASVSWLIPHNLSLPPLPSLLCGSNTELAEHTTLLCVSVPLHMCSFYLQCSPHQETHLPRNFSVKAPLSPRADHIWHLSLPYQPRTFYYCMWALDCELPKAGWFTFWQL